MAMGGGADCYERLRIEDGSDHNDIGNSCNGDHQPEEFLLRQHHQTEFKRDHQCIVDPPGASEDNETKSLTKTVPMQNNHSYDGSLGRHRPSSLPSMLICDAWYGFPTQKRPRRERIYAVGRQLHNFLAWRQQHASDRLLIQQKKQQQYQRQQLMSSSTEANERDPPRHVPLVHNPPCDIAFLGAMEDVRAVQKRVNEISQQEQLCTSARLDDFAFCKKDCGIDVEENDDDDGDAILFQPNVTIQVFLESLMLSRRQQGMQQQPQTTGDIDINNHDASTYEDTTIIDRTSCNDTMIYLSPDASYTLPITCHPPRTVILGMLVDRHTIANRSQQRAENVLGMKAAQLPLKELNVLGLHSNEPLNVDTVMEMMQRWWWNCDELEVNLQQQRRRLKSDGDDGDNKDMEDAYRKCFLDAAAWALKSHRDRHPNRTLHSK